MPQWPRNSSAAGRGYMQGSDSYRPDDVEREEAEMLRMRQAKVALRCTCFHSTSGMDVDRCPVHGADGFNIPPGGNHP